MRLFLAVPVPDPLSAELGRRVAQLRPELPRASWVRAGSVHLTLHFFGERAPERAAEIAEALAAPVAAHPPLELRLARAGSFPRSRPRVLWLGFAGEQRLLALHAALRRALEALGEPVADRPFHAHLTLARCKARFRSEHLERIDRAFADLEGRALPVGELVLYESELDPRGARHTPRARLALGGPRS